MPLTLLLSFVTVTREKLGDEAGHYGFAQFVTGCDALSRQVEANSMFAAVCVRFENRVAEVHVPAGSPFAASMKLRCAIQEREGCVMNIGYERHRMCPSIVRLTVLNEDRTVHDAFVAFIGGQDRQAGLERLVGLLASVGVRTQSALTSLETAPPQLALSAS